MYRLIFFAKVVVSRVNNENCPNPQVNGFLEPRYKSNKTWLKTCQYHGKQA